MIYMCKTIEVLSETLKELLQRPIPFGGKGVLFLGYFREFLLVAMRGFGACSSASI